MGRNAILLVILFAGCHVLEPVEPEPKSSCTEACANLARLGCEPSDCAPRCEQQNGEVDDFGTPIRAVNVDCLASAPSCDAAKRCR